MQPPPDAQPLCPELYELLVARFGAVRIANQGEELRADPFVDPMSGRFRWHIHARGEAYFVCCPFCRDTRQRLGISYAYAQVDAVTLRPAIWLAHCFNEECLSGRSTFGRDNRLELEHRIFGMVNRLDRVDRFRVDETRIVPRVPVPVELPGTVVPLDRLDPTHPAVAYVEERGFAAGELGRDFGVGFCTAADVRYPAARGRLIIPIVFRGQLVGWQGRYVGDIKWAAHGVPKYYNLPQMPKASVLYNLDNAAAGRLVVLVEGVTSAWAVGRQAVATLGHDVSPVQHDLIASTWAGRRSLLIMIFDADAERQASKHFERIRSLFAANEGSRAIRIVMDDDKDPADYDREQVWWMLRAACAEHRIDIDDYLDGDHAH